MSFFSITTELNFMTFCQDNSLYSMYDNLIFFCQILIGHILELEKNVIFSDFQIWSFIFSKTARHNLFKFDMSWKKLYWKCNLSLCSHMSLFCFFALVYTLNHNFCNETTVWEKSIEDFFYQELKKKFHRNLPIW